MIKKDIIINEKKRQLTHLLKSEIYLAGYR